ncbi:MAG TPA: PIG-L family deacetylase [Phycisphaerae bacterium]|nr:PIG-L family deacetylase [Phycisphaerae bacterium]
MAAQRQDAAPDEPLRAAVVVAHPDDETLWCGGTILAHRDWRWTVVSLCRASDPDRSPRFFQALDALGATGSMADLGDRPDQTPIGPRDVEETILSLLPGGRVDLVLSHSPLGEYTRHRRHEAVGRAVLELWSAGRLAADAVWAFAYDDAGGARLPTAVPGADRVEELAERVWREKYRIITAVYGFGPESFEARATPRTEAFWCFDSPAAARRWMNEKGLEP